MDDHEWLIEELTKLKAGTSDYPDRCVYQGVIELVQEQQKRISQANDELDGRIWSPQNW